MTLHYDTANYSLIPNTGDIIELSYKPLMVKVYKTKFGLIPLEFLRFESCCFQQIVSLDILPFFWAIYDIQRKCTQAGVMIFLRHTKTVSWYQPQQIGAGDRNIVSEYILLCAASHMFI